MGRVEREREQPRTVRCGFCGKNIPLGRQALADHLKVCPGKNPLNTPYSPPNSPEPRK